MKKIYHIKNKKELKAELAALKLSLRIREKDLQQDAKGYAAQLVKRTIGGKKKEVLPRLVPNRIKQYTEGKVMVHILPEFVRNYLMKKSGWLSRFVAHLFSKKVSKELDKAYFGKN